MPSVEALKTDLGLSSSERRVCLSMQTMLLAVVSQEQHAASGKAHASLGLQWIHRVVAEEGLPKQGGDVGHWGPSHEATQSPHLLSAGTKCWKQVVMIIHMAASWGPDLD